MATKTRLHWFWRGAIATGLATACLFGLAMAVEGTGAIRPLIRLFENARVDLRWLTVMLICIYGTVSTVPGIVAYTLLQQRYGPIVDGETRCRKCGYILRGISEPRSPECGEVI